MVLGPVLLLRLGYHQRAYNLLCWYLTTPLDYPYHGSGVPQVGFIVRNDDDAFIDFDSRDIFEDAFGEGSVRKPIVEGCFLPLKHLLLTHLSALTLLKIKLYKDVRLLVMEYARNPNTTAAERLDWLRSNAGGKGLQCYDIMVHGRPEIAMKDFREVRYIENKLKEQVMNLYAGIRAENEHYWPTLQDPSHCFSAILDDSLRREVTNLYLETYQMWKECPAALDCVNRLTNELSPL